MAADLTTQQQNELQRQKDQGRIAYYHNGCLCFKKKRRSPLRGPSASQARRQRERAYQYQHHHHSELSREYARTPDHAPPLSGDMNEYPALQRQQLPPKDSQQLQSQKTTETQGPPAATTQDSFKTTYVTTDQILEGQRAPNNGSGVTESDSGRPAVISADDNHHANADLGQWKCFQDNDNGNYHASFSHSPTDDPPLCIIWIL